MTINHTKIAGPHQNYDKDKHQYILNVPHLFDHQALLIHVETHQSNINIESETPLLLMLEQQNSISLQRIYSINETHFLKQIKIKADWFKHSKATNSVIHNGFTFQSKPHIAAIHASIIANDKGHLHLDSFDWAAAN